MKRLLLLTIFSLALQLTTAQTEVGMTGGYMNLSYENAEEGDGVYYAGLYTEFNFTNKFKFHSSYLFARSEKVNYILVPAMFKLYVAGTDLNIQAGPQATLILEDLGDFKNQVGIDGALGVGFDILNDIFVEARYAFKLNSNNLNLPNGATDFNTFTVGLGIGF